MGLAPITLPYPTVLFDRLDEFMLEFEEQDQEVQAGVATEGPPAAYALVWEWGNMRQTQRGPKTTMGVNPDGQRVWLSIQAPYGWIRIHQEQYMQFLEEEVAKVRFANPETGVISGALRKAALRAAKRVLEMMRETVPVDSGDLQSSLSVVTPDDYAVLDLAGTESDRSTLVMLDVGE